MTTDRKQDTVDRKCASISSMEDMEQVDRLREEVDAIMVGGHTLLEDDPSLMVKSEQLKQEREASPTTKNASWTTPEEIGATIAYLWSDEGGVLNGARLPLYGSP